MNKLTLSFIFSLFVLTGLATEQAAAQSSPGEYKNLDQIVAVVNDHIILKSQVDQQVRNEIQMQRQSERNIEFSENLWYSVLESMVERYVLLDQAREDSVVVTDQEVDQMINQRIDQVVNQLGSEAAVERQLGKSIVQLRADLRSSYREERIIQMYQMQKRSEIQITRPEVREYFNKIPQDSLPTIPEQVAVSQIVKIPPPQSNAKQAAREFAEQLRDSIITHGKSIEELARRHSTGPNASQGGKLPLMSVDDLVPEYSAAASALQPGGISEVVETPFGFHIIRLNQRRGDQIDTNHILIDIAQGSYDTEAAIDSLTMLRDSVLTNPEVEFTSLARQYSDDPQTAPRGGKLLNPQTGERLIPITQLNPAMYRIVLLLENPGDISEPKPYNMQVNNRTRTAYRIVRLDNRIEEHIASLDQDFEFIKQNALQEKQYRVIRKWMNELREEVYIEYKIPVPSQFANTR